MMEKYQRKNGFSPFFFSFSLPSLLLTVLQVVSLIIFFSVASQSVSSHSCFKGHSSKGGWGGKGRILNRANPKSDRTLKGNDEFTC